MPHTHAPRLLAGALVCAALFAQPFAPSLTRQTAAAAGPATRGPGGAPIPKLSSAQTEVQLGAASYGVAEGAGKVTVSVERSGDLTTALSVDYATSDGTASATSDYTGAAGTLHFAPSETAKSVVVFVVDDAYGPEGDETFNVTLSNPTGGAQLGPIAAAAVHISDNDAADGPSPVAWPEGFNGAFFVRQHYLDFLNREPDPEGFAFWQSQLFNCGVNPACVEVRRVNVSAAFFLSIEFQRTGVLAYLAHKAAFGAKAPGAAADVPLLYSDFLRDTQALQRGYVFGAPGAEARLDANKQAYFDEFVTRARFISEDASLSNSEYVTKLLANANLHRTFDTFYIFGLRGSNVVPPSDSAASGFLMLETNPADPLGDVTVSLTLRNLSSPVTAVHLHGPAEEGFNAPVIATLPAGPFTGVRVSLTRQQLTQLFDGKLYADVHTEAYPDGELRGRSPGSRFRFDTLYLALEQGILSRAEALWVVAQSEEFREAELRRAFVLMEYFGYLRRDPDAAGYAFWLDKLNQFGGNFVRAEMVKAFINSDEYRRRFGP